MMNATNANSAMTIDTIFSDTWLMVCQLRHGSPVSDGAGLYRHVCDMVDQTRERLTEKGYPEKSVENMLYAQCALIDESVMNRPAHDDGYDQWILSPLQARYFNTLEAGDKLWDRVRELLSETAPDPDVLICFHRVLTLGFAGKYHHTTSPQREQIIQQLTARVPAYALSSSLPLVVRPALRFSRRKLYWAGWVGGILLLAALWWGFSASLEQLLSQLITQGQ